MDVREQVAQLAMANDAVERAMARREPLTVPVLTDAEQMRMVCEKIKAYAKKWDSYKIGKHRRILLYAFLHFASPATCLGGRLPHGLRDQISTMLYNNATKTIISGDISICQVHYRQYRVFRERVNELIDYIETLIEGD